MPEQIAPVNTKSHHSDEGGDAGSAMSPDQAHQMLGGDKVISRSTFYSAIRLNQVPHVRVGARRIIIPRRAFLVWLQNGGLGT
jgi:hypothetical protein